MRETAPASDQEALVLLRALGHPVRFRIARVLADKQRYGVADNPCCPEDVVCVCRLLMVIDISPPALSHHLKLMRNAGLIEATKQGIWTYYSIRPGALSTLAHVLDELDPPELRA